MTVLTQIKKPDHHFNAYYHHNAVLIQFVITEFIETYELTHKIRQLANQACQSAETLKEASHLLYQFTYELLGIRSDPDRLSNSRWMKGPLTKLKLYCEQFTYNTQYQNKSSLAVCTNVYQAWIIALHTLELLNLLEQSSHTTIPGSLLLELKRILRRLDQRMRHVTKQIPRLLNAYRDNENVIYFLLKKRRQLSEIYGEETINKAFKDLFNKNSFSELIIQRYSRRGFEHLLPTIYQTTPSEWAAR